jgi:hypothetical protein
VSTTSVTSIQFPLDRDERQLWAGVPRPGIVLRPSDVFVIPFSFLWAGFTVFWELSVLRDGAPGFFALWGIPFVLMGIYITVGRFFVDAVRRSRTTYAVTSTRVLIETGRVGPFAGSTRSLALRTLGEVTLREGANGTGTITFGALPPFGAVFAGSSWPGATQIPAFESIPDARRVNDIIREAQTAAGSSR